MSRTPIATLGGIAFVLAYIVAAVGLADALPPMHWAIQACYWLVAGLLWVIPVRWLMLWAVGRR